MDFQDFWTDMSLIGGEGRGWRSFFVLGFALIGLVLGAYFGYTSAGLLQAIGYAGAGALIGWGFGVGILGMFRFAKIFIPLFLIALAITWVFGGFS